MNKPVAINGQSIVERMLVKDIKPEPSRIDEFVTEIEKDYQFAFGFRVIKSLLGSMKVSASLDDEATSPELQTHIDTDADQQDKGIKSREDHLIDAIDELWRSYIKSASRAYSHGRVAYEKEYYFDREHGLQLFKLNHLPHNKSKLVLEDDGSYGGVLVDNKVELSTMCSLWSAIDTDMLNPHGTSQYVGAPLKVWQERKLLAERENTFYRKFAIGKSVAYAPDHVSTDPVTGGGDVGEIDNQGDAVSGIKHMSEIVSSTEAGGTMILPNDPVSPDNPAKAWEFIDLPNANVAAAAPLENRRRTSDVEVLRAMGITERSVTQDVTVGSNSMAETHKSVLEDMIEDLIEQLMDTFQKYVVDKLVAMNFDSGVKIKMAYQPMSDERKALIVQLVTSIVSSPQPSPLVTAGVLDMERLLEIADLPTDPHIEDALERFREIINQQLNSSNPMAAMGADPQQLALEQPTAKPTYVQVAEENLPGLQAYIAEELGTIDPESDADKIRSCL